jgi:hypothetical protein
MPEAPSKMAQAKLGEAPQGLKPTSFFRIFGTTEVVP